MTRPARALLAAALLLLLTGCIPSTDDIERRIERELPELLGPADRYDVQIEGLRARAGRADRVTATGERVQPRDAPIIHRFVIQMEGVAYDRRDRRLDRVDTLRATAHVRPSDLDAFLEAHRNVRDAALTLREPDHATLRLRPEFGGLALPRGMELEVTGRLEARAGRVHFVVDRVEAAGAALGTAAARRLSDAVNPLIDLSHTDASLRVTDVRVENNALRLDATGNPSDLRLRRGS